MALTNCFLLLAQALVYFAVMAALFRLRDRVGVGLFVCALGVMHFLETWLASVFYVALPFGVVSPGSTVLFSGKLAMLLLLYIKEDAAAVRQPIHGLFIGNFLLVGLVLILRRHEIVPINGRAPDLAFIDEMGWLMLWGTALLYIDAIAVILLYEKLGTWLRRAPFARIAIACGCVLTVDQLGFFAALRVLSGAPFSALVGGWVAKMGAAIVYSALLVVYLRHCERAGHREPGALRDVFDALTYRERYEALVEHSGRDGLTGLQHRGRFQSYGEEALASARLSGGALTLLVIDVDHFKAINDRHGHAAGDETLRVVAWALSETVGQEGSVFRIGGEEFAVLCGYRHVVARLLGEKLRQAVVLATSRVNRPATVSIGVATATPDMRDLGELFAAADRHLYAAKAAGRDRIVGDVNGLAMRGAAS